MQKKFAVTAELLMELLIKLALIEDAENKRRSITEILTQATGIEAPECHCPACTMPNLAGKLSTELSPQMVDGSVIEDYCDPDFVAQKEDEAEAYRRELEEHATNQAAQEMAADDNGVVH